MWKWRIYIYIYIYIRLRLHTWWLHPLQLASVVFSLPPTGTDTKLMLGQLALCGGVFWVVVVVVDAYVHVVAVVVAMGCWCWENVLVLVKGKRLGKRNCGPPISSLAIAQF